jgi:hypothetical protein
MSPSKGGHRVAACCLAIVLAACVALVGARSVAVEFRSARERLVQAEIRPAPGEPIVRVVPATTDPLSVLIAQVRGGAQAGPLEIRTDGRTVSRVNLQAGRRTRIDVQVPAGLVAGSRVELSCASSGWALTSLELANLHGFSSGLFSALFLPASRRDFRAIPWWLMPPAFVLLAALWSPPRAGSYPRVEAIVASLGVLALVIALASPLFSSYALVLSVPTFLLCIALVFGVSARRRYLSLRARVAASHGAAARRIDASIVVVAILAFYAAVASHGLAVNGGNYTGFLHFSELFAGAPVLSDHPEVRASLKTDPTGYDGQFMFLMAFDPLLAKYEPARYAQVVDSPPYRYGRIGFSLLTRVFSGGRPGAFAATMVWLIVGAHLAGAWFLVRIAASRGASPWQVLPSVLIPGFLVSLGSALPESLAAALLLGGLFAHLRGRQWPAAAWWAASLLVRETGAILVLAMVAWTLVTRLPDGSEPRENARRSTSGPGFRLSTLDFRRSLPLLAAFVPVALWRLYVGFRLYPAFGWRAWWSDPADLTWPFAGFLQLWSVNDAAHGHGQAFNTWFPLLLVALLALAAALLRVRRTGVAGAAVAYGVLAVSLDYRQIWSWVGNGERGTFELFLLVLVAALPFGSLPRGLRWALTAFGIALFAYDFRVATYASWFRPGLIVFR